MGHNEIRYGRYLALLECHLNTRHDYEHHHIPPGVYLEMFALIFTRGVAPAEAMVQVKSRGRCAAISTAVLVLVLPVTEHAMPPRLR